MPELPEVETIVNDLNRVLKDKNITGTEVFHSKPLSNCNPTKFIAFCRGEQFSRIERKGKYLLFIFTSGKKIVVHLRMTGKFQFFSPYQSEIDHEKHQRLLFLLENNEALIYHDVRIFGTFVIYAPDEEVAELNKVGFDPFNNQLTAVFLKALAEKRKVCVKNFLLDQKMIAGIGNIYACEILFACRIHPAKPACQLDINEWEQILMSTRQILQQAIEAGGTTISDYRALSERKGSYQNKLQVYQRENQLCLHCRQAEIIRILQGQRSTFFCPVCQKL